MTHFLLGLGLALSMVACAGNDCTRSTDRTIARFAECGVTTGSDGNDDDEQDVSDVACTDELAADRTRTADCTERASCAALTGNDQAGADAYSQCLLE